MNRCLIVGLPSLPSCWSGDQQQLSNQQQLSDQQQLKTEVTNKNWEKCFFMLYIQKRIF
jgi:hypothetical protein